jgi:hypothetical protein
MNMEETNETGTNPAGAQSRAGEAGANLSVGLAAYWTDNDIAEVIEQAHMAGQINQGHCDPSAYEAMVYRKYIMAANVEITG